jgi:hypothetical protein
MKLVVDVPEYIVERARGLVHDGVYRDLSSFAAASMENQLALEAHEETVSTAHAAASRKRPQAQTRASLSVMHDAAPERSSPPALEYPESPGRTVAEQWPWGQINRILPAKFAVRLLDKELTLAEPVIPFDAFRNEAAARARDFGVWLKENDTRYRRRRGERLSAGFPTGDDEESSLKRYAVHFIGHRRKRDDTWFGALFELKFANAAVMGREISLGLTEAGLQFARIENPILDRSDVSSTLSDEEIEFYLDHIQKRVPGETYAFQLILGLIEDGVTRRRQLNEAIKAAVGLGWTEALANTQRSGAMARMYELALIDKARDGLRVRYGTTPRGMAWLTGTR